MPPIPQSEEMQLKFSFCPTKNPKIFGLKAANVDVGESDIRKSLVLYVIRKD